MPFPLTSPLVWWPYHFFGGPIFPLSYLVRVKSTLLPFPSFLKCTGDSHLNSHHISTHWPLTVVQGWAHDPSKSITETWSGSYHHIGWLFKIGRMEEWERKSNREEVNREKVESLNHSKEFQEVLYQYYEINTWIRFMFLKPTTKILGQNILSNCSFSHDWLFSAGIVYV